ncbi:hypothetical protein CAEBREN_07102 [Caenorhabditis brenneri]|uniref:Uncharacterized protein n=1 Tax=Caenorhabditis brenneri TaxID=135651 RepID=G0MJR8_CAEBE|nr:hypothetical protein CAEBREN_07102 [Caenorhabditis brenneri]
MKKNYRAYDENSTQPNVNYWTYERGGKTWYVDEDDISEWGAWFQDHISPVEISLFAVSVFFSCVVGCFWLVHFKNLRNAYKSSLLVGRPVPKPKLPIQTELLDEFKGNEWRRRPNIPEPRVYVGSELKYAAHHHLYSVNAVTSIVRMVLKIERPLKYDRNSLDCQAEWHRWAIPIPDNSKVVAIAMTGFGYGRECYHFHPIRGAKRWSHYTYQMYGNNRCIVTRYHEDDKVYVAGFCLFIKNPCDHGYNYPVKAIRALCESSVFPGDDLEKLRVDRERLRLELIRKAHSESNKEPGEIAVTVVNEEAVEETPILESKSVSINLDDPPPNLGYTKSPENEELSLNPSMTPESLRGNIVPLASSEESSLLGSEVDTVSLGKRIQKDGYVIVEVENVNADDVEI